MTTTKKPPIRRSVQQSRQRADENPAPGFHQEAKSAPAPVSTVRPGADSASLATWSKISMPAWVALPLRLFLGITFVYAGLQKLTDPQFFRPSAPGYIGKQIAGMAHGTPLGSLLTHLVVPHAMLFGGLIAWGEVAIGLGVLVGVLVRPAAYLWRLAELHVLPFGQLASLSILLWLGHCIFLWLDSDLTRRPTRRRLAGIRRSNCRLAAISRARKP